MKKVCLIFSVVVVYAVKHYRGHGISAVLLLQLLGNCYIHSWHLRQGDEDKAKVSQTPIVHATIELRVQLNVESDVASVAIRSRL